MKGATGGKRSMFLLLGDIRRWTCLHVMMSENSGAFSDLSPFFSFLFFFFPLSLSCLSSTFSQVGIIEASVVATSI